MVKPVGGAGGGAAALRKEAEAALRLEREGRHKEALARVDELAARNTGSALVLHLGGLLHHAAARRAIAASEKKETAHHLVTAHDYLVEAKRLVPNCIDISVRLARVLFEGLKHDEAENEVRRAIGTPFPVDPAENNVVYSVEARVSTTREQRVENCRESARICFRIIGEWICNKHVPRVVSEVLELDTDEREGVTKALKTANDLAKRYSYSSRAHLIRAYMRLMFARCLDATIDRRPFLDRILVDMNEAVDRFDGSLVLAMFRAKLCFVLGLYDALYLECGRAVDIQDPVDPKLEDVPPGSVNGEERDDRVSSIFQEIACMLRRLLWLAKRYWCSMTSEKQDAYLSVGLVELHKFYDEIYEKDHWAAKTISDALSFFKKNRSWRFWICPFCVGKKLPDTDSLLRHMCNKHPAEKVLLKLRSVLDPKPSDDTSEDDYSLDEITVCQDSEDHYFFQFKKTDYIFEHLFLRAASGIEAKSFSEIREEKCKQGTEILEKVKQKLKNLPAENSAEFDKASSEIQDLWHDFLTISALDYRVVILTLAKASIWTKLINSMSEDNAASKSIDNADIDAIFPNVVDPPDDIATVEHGSKLSNGNKDHKSADDQQTGNMKPSHSEETLNADEKCEESEVHVEDRNSGTMETQILSEPPIFMDDNGIWRLSARIADVAVDKKGISGQSVEEMASTSSYQHNADKDLFILRVIIQSLCNLKHFRDKFLTGTLVWTPSSDNPCIADMLYGIFSAWERNEHQLTVVQLTSVKTILCRIVDDSSMYEKVGENFASETVATILIGLHMSETSSCLSFNIETERQVVNPITCGDCVCPTHDLFGIRFDAQMSCRCGKFSDKYLYTTLFHKLDAGSPKTTEIKSFAELPFLLDEQFCEDSNCEHCGSPRNIDLFLSNTPHFFTIVLDWTGGSQNQDTLSELLARIMSPLDTEFFCRSAHSATKYTVASMVCYADDRYVCFARNEDKWLIYDSETVETEDDWELLERFRDCKLRPEVLFFEVIK